MIIPKYSVLARAHLPAQRRDLQAEIYKQNKMFGKFQKDKKSLIHKI